MESMDDVKGGDYSVNYLRPTPQGTKRTKDHEGIFYFVVSDVLISRPPEKLCG
jgi:hypothetical protein